MNQKSGIIEALGEEALLLPDLVERAIVANEQAKYLLSLLQLARLHADCPGVVHRGLRAEREAAGIDDPGLDEVVPGSMLLRDGLYRVPHLDRILDGIRGAVDAMVRPLSVLGGPGADAFRARGEALSKTRPARGPDVIGRAEIAALTAGDRGAGDSPHLLVMDLHRALATLVEDLGCESIDGAQAWMIDGADRGLVCAFMRGLNRTAPLRFDHPGLATTAIRTGDRLLVQNDIGVTGAHVLVVSVAETTVTVTYTDVHAARLAFFQSLLDGWGVRWSGTVSRPAPTPADGTCHLSVGRLAATDRDRCAAFLEHLGSRIVFLIDWNKARRQLRAVLSEQDAVTVLARAAADEFGHRAFLELGGTDLVDEALDLAARGRPGIPGPLDLQIGSEAAMACMGRVLAIAAGGMRRGEPHALLRGRCRAEILEALDAARADLLERCAAHADLVAEAALVLSDAVDALRWGSKRVLANADRARRIEREADLLVAAARSAPGLPVEGGLLPEVVAAQDGAVDALEEGCYFVSLLDDGTPLAGELEVIGELVDLAVAAGRSYLAALQQARAGAGPGGRFLAEARRVAVTAEACDAAKNRAVEYLAAGRHGPRRDHAVAGIATAVATAAGALAGAVVLLRHGAFGPPAETRESAQLEGVPVTSGSSPAEAPRSP